MNNTRKTQKPTKLRFVGSVPGYRFGTDPRKDYLQFLAAVRGAGTAGGDMYADRKETARVHS
jgi:hypothetical protein